MMQPNRLSELRQLLSQCAGYLPREAKELRERIRAALARKDDD